MKIRSAALATHTLVMDAVALFEALEPHWGRAPVVLPAMGVDALFSSADVEACLDGGLAEHDTLRAQTVDGVPTAYAQIRPDEARAAFEAGDTIRILDVHEGRPTLEAFARAFADAVSFPTDIAAYITPANRGGFPLHCDEQEILILQASGTKHWRVYGAVPPPDDRDVPDPAALGPVLVDAVLRRGDVLYIPRRCWHAGTSGDAISVHLTAAAWPFTVGDLLRVAAHFHRDEPLPIGFLRAPRLPKVNWAAAFKCLARQVHARPE